MFKNASILAIAEILMSTKILFAFFIFATEMIAALMPASQNHVIGQ